MTDWAGLTDEEYTLLILDCSATCILCNKPFSSTRRPARDHDHLTGLIRGVPCTACNRWLGENHEDAGKLLRAYRYLSNPPAVRLIGRRYVPGSPGAEGVLP